MSSGTEYVPAGYHLPVLGSSVPELDQSPYIQKSTDHSQQPRGNSRAPHSLQISDVSQPSDWHKFSSSSTTHPSSDMHPFTRSQFLGHLRVSESYALNPGIMENLEHDGEYNDNVSDPMLAAQLGNNNHTLRTLPNSRQQHSAVPHTTYVNGGPSDSSSRPTRQASEAPLNERLAFCCRCGAMGDMSNASADGPAIQCPTCECWSHIACQRRGRADTVPQGHFKCDFCTPMAERHENSRQVTS
jgi:hypothetical protein